MAYWIDTLPSSSKQFWICAEAPTESAQEVEADAYEAAVLTARQASAEALAAETPQSVTRWQFFQQSAVAGDITQDEALAALAGIIPAKLLEAIDALPEAARFPAKMRVAGAATFLRSDPLTAQLGQAMGRSAADLDAFWTAAAAL